MTLETTFALFVTMLVLALVPGASSLLVAVRSAGGGFTHGLATIAGIIVGDLVFILLAIYGWSLLNQKLTVVLPLVKYAAGIYLIWLGINLWRIRSPAAQEHHARSGSLGSDFLAGLVLTLGDQKAIWFYLGLLPAFVDLRRVTFVDTGLVMLALVLAACGSKLIYAYLGDRARVMLAREAPRKIVHRLAALVLIVIGGLVALVA